VVIRDVENIWIVAYIDPKCGACKKFSIEWEKLRTVETIKYKKVKLGYVDVTLAASRKIVGKYTQGKEVEGTPTLFVYGNEKMKPIEFKGDLTAGSVNDYLVAYAEENGYEYSTDADVDHNHAKAASKGTEAALPTKGPIKVVGAVKITNRQI
jgi:glutaredoxin